MQRLRYLIGVQAGLLILLSACGPVTDPPPQTSRAVAPPPALTVNHVADGDTVGLSDGRKIRVLGIDTPESVKPNAPVDCYGLEASAFAKATLLGQRITVTGDPTQDRADRYGRELAYLTLPDGRDYSIAAAEAGMARSYIYNGRPVQKHQLIRDAEVRAQQARRGLWGACETPPPVTTQSQAPATSTSARPSPAPAPVTNKPDVATGSFANCAAARAAGAAPLHRGDSGYSSRLDRDGDGVACE